MAFVLEQTSDSALILRRDPLYNRQAWFLWIVAAALLGIAGLAPTLDLPRGLAASLGALGIALAAAARILRLLNQRIPENLRFDWKQGELALQSDGDEARLGLALLRQLGLQAMGRGRHCAVLELIDGSAVPLSPPLSLRRAEQRAQAIGARFPASYRRSARWPALSSKIDAQQNSAKRTWRWRPRRSPLLISLSIFFLALAASVSAPLAIVLWIRPQDLSALLPHNAGAAFLLLFAAALFAMALLFGIQALLWARAMIEIEYDGRAIRCTRLSSARSKRPAPLFTLPLPSRAPARLLLDFQRGTAAFYFPDVADPKTQKLNRQRILALPGLKAADAIGLYFALRRALGHSVEHD